MNSCVLAAALALVVLVPADEKASPGAPLADLSFKTVLGGDGRRKISEFRGQPVIVAWYSTVFAGTEAARVAVDMEEKNGGDGLVVFLMDIKNHDEKYLRALQMKELPGAASRLIKTSNLGVAYDDVTGPPPKMVLVGVDGTLRYAGSYQRASEVRKLLAAELEKKKAGWGADALAKKARAAAFGKGELGQARALLGDAPQGEQAAAAREIETRFETRKRSVGHHVEQGEPALALLASSELAKAAKGRPAWEADAAETARTLEGEAFARELELARELDKVLEPLRKKAPKDGIDAKLRELATRASGTKVGARAQQLADAAAYALNGLK